MPQRQRKGQLGSNWACLVPVPRQNLIHAKIAGFHHCPRERFEHLNRNGRIEPRIRGRAPQLFCAARWRQVIFRGSRVFLLGHSVECVENTGIRHGAMLAVVKGRGGEASRGSL